MDCFYHKIALISIVCVEICVFHLINLLGIENYMIMQKQRTKKKKNLSSPKFELPIKLFNSVTTIIPEHAYITEMKIPANSESIRFCLLPK